MPFKSQAQRRKFYAMADRGEISKETLKEWEDATPKGKKLPERVKQAKRDMRIPAALFGAGVGSLVGYARESEDEKADLRNTLIGAGIGALLGFGGTHFAHRRHLAKARPRWMGSVSTKAQAKKKYHAESFKAHPDRGGSEARMKKLNEEWNAFKDSPEYEKLAFLQELGAILGTAHGWRGHVKQALDPRLGGALVGAGLGGLTGYATGDHPFRNTLIGAGIGGALGYGGGALFRRHQLAQEAMHAEEARVAAERVAERAEQMRRAREAVRVKQQRAMDKMQAQLNADLEEKLRAAGASSDEILKVMNDLKNRGLGGSL